MRTLSIFSVFVIAHVAHAQEWPAISCPAGEFVTGVDDNNPICLPIDGVDSLNGLTGAVELRSSDGSISIGARDQTIDLTASETDPVFGASAAAGITSTDIANWDQMVTWGDHSTAGYLTSEADPAFTASVAGSITAGDVAAWNEMATWGNHADAGYLTSESDPTMGTFEPYGWCRTDGSQIHCDAPAGITLQRTVVLGPSGTFAENGAALLAAVTAITDAAEDRRYLIHLEPGVYDLEQNGLFMKSWVSLEGSGQDTTFIRADSMTAANTGIINGASNSEVRRLTLDAYLRTGGWPTHHIHVDSGVSFRAADVHLQTTGPLHADTGRGFRVIGGGSLVLDRVTADLTNPNYSSSVETIGEFDGDVTIRDSALTWGHTFGLDCLAGSLTLLRSHVDAISPVRARSCVTRIDQSHLSGNGTVTLGTGDDAIVQSSRLTFVDIECEECRIQNTEMADGAVLSVSPTIIGPHFYASTLRRINPVDCGIFAASVFFDTPSSAFDTDTLCVASAGKVNDVWTELSSDCLPRSDLVVTIPDVLDGIYRCNDSPPVAWSTSYNDADSWALVLRNDNNVVWIIWDIPDSFDMLDSGIDNVEFPGTGGRQGYALDGSTWGYLPLCPSGASNVSLRLDLFALDVATLPGITSGMDSLDVIPIIESHTLHHATAVTLVPTIN